MQRLRTRCIDAVPYALQATMLKLEVAQATGGGGAIAEAQQYLARAAYMENAAKSALDLLRSAAPASHVHGAAQRIRENLPPLPAHAQPSVPMSGA